MTVPTRESLPILHASMLPTNQFLRSEEDFSYFTLLRPKTDTEPATSLFGISCTRQLDSTQLINRPADVTR